MSRKRDTREFSLTYKPTCNLKKLETDIILNQKKIIWNNT